MDARIISLESPHGVRRPLLQDKGGVAGAGDTCPAVAFIIGAVDGHAVECHGVAVGNNNLFPLLKRAGEHIAVLGRIIVVSTTNVVGEVGQLNLAAHLHREGVHLACIEGFPCDEFRVGVVIARAFVCSVDGNGLVAAHGFHGHIDGPRKFRGSGRDGVGVGAVGDGRAFDVAEGAAAGIVLHRYLADGKLVGECQPGQRGAVESAQAIGVVVEARERLQRAVLVGDGGLVSVVVNHRGGIDIFHRGAGLGVGERHREGGRLAVVADVAGGQRHAGGLHRVVAGVDIHHRELLAGSKGLHTILAQLLRTVAGVEVHFCGKGDIADEVDVFKVIFHAADHRCHSHNKGGKNEISHSVFHLFLPF